MRLIDADKLLEKHTCDVYGAYDDSCMLKAVFVPYIKGAPTVDAAEVVRCNWISVSERLPEQNGRYLCNVKSFAFPGKFYQAILMCDKHGFREGNIYTDDVTHWMPLSEPPKEDGHAIGFVDADNNPIRQKVEGL